MAKPETLLKLKQDIIEALNLEVKAEDVPDDSPIFAEGLGLDSIDALELIVLLERNYSIKLADQEQAKKIFISVRTLADFIDEQAA